MKCPSCGAESDGGRFCAYCGSELPGNNAQPIVPAAQSYHSNNVTNHITNVYYINQASAETFPFQGPSMEHSDPLRNNEQANTDVSLLQYPVKNSSVSYENQEKINVDATNYSAKALVSDKNKGIAFLLCFFLGLIGIHHFYSGRWKMGLLYMFTVGLFGVGWLIDLILIMCNSYKDSQGLPIKGGGSIWIFRIIYLLACYYGYYSLKNSSIPSSVSIVIMLIFSVLFLLSFL